VLIPNNFVSTTTDPKGTTTASNIVAVEGSDATFRLQHQVCTWAYVNDGTPITLYDHKEMKEISSRYYVNRTLHNQCDLTIKKVTFSDSGIYQHINGDVSSATLTVVGKEPTCSVSTKSTADVVKDGIQEGEELHYSCSVTTSSNRIKPPPRLEWLMLSNCTKYEGDDKCVQLPGRQSEFTSTLLYKAHPPKVSPFRCCLLIRGYPSYLSKDPNLASNEVVFESCCKTEEIQYSFPANNIRILNNTNGFMQIGDAIFCQAEGYPDVQYLWKNSSESIVDVGPVLHLREKPGLHQYKCIAYHQIGNKNHTIEKHLSVLIQSTTETNELKLTVGLMIIIVVIPCVSVTIIVFLIFALIYICRKKPRPATEIDYVVSTTTPANNKLKSLNSNNQQQDDPLLSTKSEQ